MIGGIYDGTVTEQEAGNKVSALVPGLFEAEALTGIVPLLPPYIEAQPPVDAPIRVLAMGGEYYYMSLAKPGSTTDAATEWTPLRTILLAILGNLDQLNGHGHSIGIGGISVGSPPTVYTNPAPVAVPAVSGCAYGNARTDTEANEPASEFVRLVTTTPAPEAP